MTSTLVPVWDGCSPEGWTVPQLRDARALLINAGIKRAQVTDTGRVLAAGAYLDPRSATGEVVLSYTPTTDDDHPAYSERMRRAMETKHATDSYRELFREAGWDVSEIADPAAGGVLPRFILAQRLVCEMYLATSGGHCTARAVRVVHSVTDPAARVLLCEGHPQAFPGAAWTSTTPQAYQAAHGLITQDENIHGGRKAPAAPVPPTRRPARCEDCGESIEADSDGFRTLCACDAAE
ncbi:hypothetical protein [Streptomyces sp. CA2R106]|uniref:hypothetical protein n=1 Tax=Streptomyces sp. CA2R106 TaxID=3120153 RepID=UPI0030099916